MNNTYPIIEGYRFDDPKAALKYLTGKKGLFTLVSNKTGRHFTFKTYQFAKHPEYTYIKTRVGNYFVDLATIKDGKSYKAANNAKRNTTNFKAFSWVFRFLLNGIMPSSIKIYHHGTCCNCGRTLTNPESIKIGIGPECYKKIGFQGG